MDHPDDQEPIRKPCRTDPQPTVTTWSQSGSRVVRADDSATSRSDAGHPLPAPPTGSPVDGRWDHVLDTVTARLRRTVATDRRGSRDLRGHDDAERIRRNILECASTLESLHTTLSERLDHCHQLEVAMLDSTAALARARSELIGTQDGERRARHMALHDGLTALPNRRHFRERLDHALSACDTGPPTLALFFLDLDGFKPVNDEHGHQTGDELLRIIAARLTRAVRAEDMVGRLGGDEFACLLSDQLDRDQLGHLAGKLFDAVATPLKIGPLRLTVRPSIGIAICPTDGNTADTLLERADAAMYRAKRLRSGFAFFDATTDGQGLLQAARPS